MWFNRICFECAWAFRDEIQINCFFRRKMCISKFHCDLCCPLSRFINIYLAFYLGHVIYPKYVNTHRSHTSSAFYEIVFFIFIIKDSCSNQTLISLTFLLINTHSLHGTIFIDWFFKYTSCYCYKFLRLIWNSIQHLSDRIVWIAL